MKLAFFLKLLIRFSDLDDLTEVKFISSSSNSEMQVKSSFFNNKTNKLTIVLEYQ